MERIKTYKLTQDSDTIFKKCLDNWLKIVIIAFIVIVAVKVVLVIRKKNTPKFIHKKYDEQPKPYESLNGINYVKL
jgi:hypothetical protein